MKTPIDLGELFCSVLNTQNVYYQPPESKKLNYPCVIYQFSRYEQKRADDISYFNHKCYLATYIDKDPCSTVPDEILNLPMCRFDRFYVSDGLNHWVFVIYF